MDSNESPSRPFAKGVGYKRTFTVCHKIYTFYLAYTDGFTPGLLELQITKSKGKPPCSTIAMRCRSSDCGSAMRESLNVRLAKSAERSAQDMART